MKEQQGVEPSSHIVSSLATSSCLAVAIKSRLWHPSPSLASNSLAWTWLVMNTSSPPSPSPSPPSSSIDPSSSSDPEPPLWYCDSIRSSVSLAGLSTSLAHLSLRLHLPDGLLHLPAGLPEGRCRHSRRRRMTTTFSHYPSPALGILPGHFPLTSRTMIYQFFLLARHQGNPTWCRVMREVAPRAWRSKSRQVGYGYGYSRLRGA